MSSVEMGGAKQQQIIDDERGYSRDSDKYVCSNHFGDPDLKKFVEENAIAHECDFCDPQDDDDEEEVIIRAASINDVLDKIMSAVAYFFDDPANGLGYASSEGGWITGEEVFDNGMELLQDGLSLEQCYQVEFEVVEELAKHIGDQQWTRNEFYGETHSDYLSRKWRAFSDLVKYRVRFVFTNVETDDEEYGLKQKPSEVLEEIGEFIHRMGLVKEFFRESDELFKEEFPIYRCRQHKKGDVVLDCAAIGTTPRTSAGANRFSPEGIPIFYGASEVATAIAEVVQREGGSRLSIGEFKPKRPLNLIDLRNISAMGYFGDIELVEPSYFLRDFVKEISKKILHGEHQIEYIPSQVVTEYFRFVLPSIVGKEIHGLAYRSAQKKGKDCFAIFAEGENCANEGLENDKTLLILKKGSIKLYKVSAKIK